MQSQQNIAVIPNGKEIAVMEGQRAQPLPRPSIPSSRFMVTTSGGSSDSTDCNDNDCGASQSGMVTVSTNGPQSGRCVIPASTECVEANNNLAREDHGVVEECLRPILVGYSFGPKKMSTMGVVMAEASMALSTVTMAATRVKATASFGSGKNAGIGVTARPPGRGDDIEDVAYLGASPTCSKTQPPRLTSATLKAREQSKRPSSSLSDASDEEETLSLADNDAGSASVPPTSGVFLSIAGGPEGDGAVGIRNIARHFQSSCSSAASLADVSFADSSITTTTAAVSTPCALSGSSMMGVHSIGSASVWSGGCVSSLRTDRASGVQAETRLQSVRVSFVPLDLDSPLEEQHGGKFDAILHKMTEDILCVSEVSHSAGRANNTETDTHTQAKDRIDRLKQYKVNNQGCCLVDHPSFVQRLMSRSDIARVLSECLKNVTTRSGVAAAAPKFVIFSQDEGRDIEAVIKDASFTYPIIVKPLPAAGTKSSHHMVIVLNRKGLRSIAFPCILQEYANHDARLYKVYVLGDTVRVFPRKSLPNLPRGERDHEIGFVKFDSQQPYPILADFGLPEPPVGQPKEEAGASKQAPLFAPVASQPRISSMSSKKRRRAMSPVIPGQSSSLANLKIVTADEIRPLSNTLGKAFGLQLFGFDILVTKGDDGQKKLLVVDVNYFPSYKEMSNFPSLLAQYLTEKAVQGRLRSVNK